MTTKAKLIEKMEERLKSIIDTDGDYEASDGFRQAIDIITESLKGYSVVPDEATEAEVELMLGALGEVQIFGKQPYTYRDSVLAVRKAMISIGDNGNE